MGQEIDAEEEKKEKKKKKYVHVNLLASSVFAFIIDVLDLPMSINSRMRFGFYRCDVEPRSRSGNNVVSIRACSFFAAKFPSACYSPRFAAGECW